ncbi:MAG: tape measure protein [Oscillospiraceae bacterium]|nr:MAG: tape measure protein [Oscillospiraceae bacterium]
MADIHSRFILDDQASNPLAGYITVAKNAASATTAAQRQLKSYESALRSTELASAKATAAFEASAQQLDTMRAAGEAGTAAYKQLETQNERLRLKVEALDTQTGILTGKAREAQAAAEKEAAAFKDQADAAEKASKSTKELSDNQKNAISSADALASAVKRLAASYLSIQGLKKAVDLSDGLVSTRARLDRMNDGLQTTQQLETMIYQSAQRSRGNFMDTMGLVSQLGTMAGSAFGNTKEIVQFAEQLNKQLALSGASGQAAQAAILQLEQGLASGVLRGDELNSVMEQAPAIARSIADYLQVDMGKLREMGAQGQITAAIVKNAMFAAAAETNAEFAKTPMTWAQVWTVASNAAIRALDPLLAAINWVANNIQTVVPIVISLGTAFGVLLIAANWTNILAFASEKAAAAQAFLNAVMAANPAALAAAAVLVLVAALYAGVAVMNHFAGTSVSATGIITGAFAVMGAFVFNSVLVPLQNGFAMFANFVGNVFTNPVAAVKVLFYDMAITVLQYMQNIASAVEGLINMIPGVTVDLTSGLGGWITDLAKKRSDEIQNSGYTEYVKPWENMDLGSAYTRGYDWGSNLSLGNLFGPGGLGDLGVPQAADVNSLLNNVGAIKNNTGKIAKTVDLSDEQLKMMVDIAERKFVNNINLTSQAPVITVQGQNTGNTEADRQSLADLLGDLIMERVQSGSVVAVN